mmetsp:Transcript_71616/g.108168  ORF Transcript_71616/g.108168 Transcript_71616/m.108168 type:complete len:240 (+) Transcript_71616:278-997(+)
MDNRAFTRLNENARRTVQVLSSFLDHVKTMPGLSCQEFKEMRALSQFERSVRGLVKDYFQPSNRNNDNPSGFERFVFQHANMHKNNIRKVNAMRWSAKDWADQLVSALERDINDGLPEEIEKICKEVDFETKSKLDLLSKVRRKESAGSYATKGLIYGGVLACLGTAGFSFGFSLLAIPAYLGIARLHSKTWKRDEVIRDVVFGISEKFGDKYRSQINDQFTTHVDEAARQIQSYFELL